MDQHIIALPEHINPDQDNRASAPYNFVPLPDTVVPAVQRAEDLPGYDTFGDDVYQHSGYFIVKLTTKSHLYIRGMLTTQQFERQEAGQYVDDGEPIPDKSDNPEAPNPEFRRLAKNLPHFFNLENKENKQKDGEPVIPGSSLRGMLRNLLEIVTYSKPQPVTDNRLAYRTYDMSSLREMYMRHTVHRAGPRRFYYPTPRLKAGYLQSTGTGWQICPAKEPGGYGESFVHIWRGDANGALGFEPQEHHVYDVYVEPAPRSWYRGRRVDLNLALTSVVTNNPVPGLEPAKLVVSGDMQGKKWHCAVFEEDTNATPIPITHELWQLYQADLSVSRGRKLKENSPLFYLLDSKGNLVFFGPTKFFRLPYTNSPVDLIPKMLRKPEVIDYGEAMFGFIRTDKELEDMRLRGLQIPKQGEKARAYAGRIYVTQAALDEGQSDVLHSEVITPSILATPKPTAVQHYLTQPSIPKKDGGQGYNLTKLHHYDSRYDGKDTTIRGYKLYWHQGNRTLESMKAQPGSPNVDDEGVVEERSTQHTQIRPINPETTFTFKVFFENLSDEELGALCWTLHPFGKPEKQYCHKLGMAKPLGMGSVNLDATLLLVNRVDRYTELFDKSNRYWNIGIGEGIKLSDRAELERLTRSFEADILTRLNLKESTKYLYELLRVGLLLKLLEWPGQVSNNTRQMQIQPNNQFKYRPVLPTPREFGDLTGDKQPGNGIKILQKAEVIWVDESGVMLEFNDVSLQLLVKDVIGKILPSWLSGQDYAEGDIVECVIEQIFEDEYEILLFCRPLIGPVSK